MFLSGKNLFVYRLNQVTEVIAMVSIIATAAIIFSLIFVNFC